MGYLDNNGNNEEVYTQPTQTTPKKKLPKKVNDKMLKDILIGGGVLGGGIALYFVIRKIMSGGGKAKKAQFNNAQELQQRTQTASNTYGTSTLQKTAGMNGSGATITSGSTEGRSSNDVNYYVPSTVLSTVAPTGEQNTLWSIAKARVIATIMFKANHKYRKQYLGDDKNVDFSFPVLLVGKHQIMMKPKYDTKYINFYQYEDELLNDKNKLSTGIFEFAPINYDFNSIVDVIRKMAEDPNSQLYAMDVVVAKITKEDMRKSGQDERKIFKVEPIYMYSPRSGFRSWNYNGDILMDIMKFKGKDPKATVKISEYRPVPIKDSFAKSVIWSGISDKDLCLHSKMPPCQPNVWQPLPGEKVKYDIVFTGTTSNHKASIVLYWPKNPNPPGATEQLKRLQKMQVSYSVDGKILQNKTYTPKDIETGVTIAYVGSNFQNDFIRKLEKMWYGTVTNPYSNPPPEDVFFQLTGKVKGTSNWKLIKNHIRDITTLEEGAKKYFTKDLFKKYDKLTLTKIKEVGNKGITLGQTSSATLKGFGTTDSSGKKIGGYVVSKDKKKIEQSFDNDTSARQYAKQMAHAHVGTTYYVGMSNGLGGYDWIAKYAYKASNIPPTQKKCQYYYQLIDEADFSMKTFSYRTENYLTKKDAIAHMTSFKPKNGMIHMIYAYVCPKGIKNNVQSIDMGYWKRVNGVWTEGKIINGKWVSK